MRAVVLHEYGGPEKLKFEDNVPDPHVSGNTALIAAAAASVNPIDRKVRSGARQKDFPLSFPAILGRDVSGVVQAVGANVKHFKPGDRVLALSSATYAERSAPGSDNRWLVIVHWRSVADADASMKSFSTASGTAEWMSMIVPDSMVMTRYGR